MENGKAPYILCLTDKWLSLRVHLGVFYGSIKPIIHLHGELIPKAEFLPAKWEFTLGRIFALLTFVIGLNRSRYLVKYKKLNNFYI